VELAFGQFQPEFWRRHNTTKNLSPKKTSKNLKNNAKFANFYYYDLKKLKKNFGGAIFFFG